jgi:hypothetical protein
LAIAWVWSTVIGGLASIITTTAASTTLLRDEHDGGYDERRRSDRLGGMYAIDALLVVGAVVAPARAAGQRRHQYPDRNMSFHDRLYGKSFSFFRLSS